MAKKVKAENLIKTEDDLITSREKTRAGFVSMALEKNYIAIPYIEEAKALKSLASQVKKPKDLLQVSNLRVGLLTASGLSSKSLNHLTEEDKTLAIEGLIEKFLEPAGVNFIDELVYRYLLTKGDALGGKARNLAGSLGERKFLRSLLSIFNLTGIDYKWKNNDMNSWFNRPKDDSEIEKRIKALHWKVVKANRLLIININVPLVNKNVDLSILDGEIDDLESGKQSIVHNYNRYIALGELKGGIDPAGADEHWKTANSALNRVRASFSEKKLKPKTFFIGAAIERSMATEIFKQLHTGIMSNAANLTNDDQLMKICSWIVYL